VVNPELACLAPATFPAVDPEVLEARFREGYVAFNGGDYEAAAAWMREDVELSGRRRPRLPLADLHEPRRCARRAGWDA
jgi:hypothetical protein